MGNETDPIVPCLPSQELTGTHSFPPKGPNQQRPGVLTKGLATKGAGSGRGGHPRDCRHVTPGTGSGKEGHPEDCGHRTPGARSGWDHPGDFRHVTPGTGLGRRVTLETVDMRPQVQGLGVRVTLETVDM